MDVSFLILAGGGLAVLAGGAVLGRRSRDRRSRRLGMGPMVDLSHLPVELQHTALWAISDGGNERGVVGGTASLGQHDVPITVFDLETLRLVRGEWAYLDMVPPFRGAGVITVVACVLPRPLPHLLVKRAGDSDLVEHRPGDLASVTATIRDGLGVQRAMKADRPPRLPADASAIDCLAGGTGSGFAAPWRAWAEDPAAARRLLDEPLTARLTALPDGFEPVIETLDHLVLVWTASPSPLTDELLTVAVDLAEAVSERALAISPVLDPRGVAG